MSTTFEVWPGGATIPSFRTLLEAGNEEMNRFLQPLGLRRPVEFQVELVENVTHRRQSIDLQAPARWGEDEYAWFTVPGVAGGTDVDFRPANWYGRDELWLDELEENKRIQWAAPAVRAAIAVGHYWSVRRSAGQPALIALGYGVLAGTLARLTGGFLYSDDGAWDYHRCPADADTFLAQYFRPELAIPEELQEWFIRLWAALPDELREGGYL